MNNSKILNILISTHELSPIQGSECAEGWNIIKNLAKNKQINLFVIYAQGSQYSPNSYKDAIDAYYQENELESNLNFISIKQPKLTLIIAKINQIITRNKGSIGFSVFYFMGYSFWQKKAFKVAQELIKVHNIDLIHHLTQITFREPGFLWKINIPFIWGPTGGIAGIPRQILRSLSLKQKIFELIRNFSNLTQFYFKCRIKNAMLKSKLIYTFSNEDLIKISLLNPNVKILLDSGTIPLLNPKIRKFNYSEKLKIIWAGQLIERKGLILLIDALNKIKNVNDKVEVNILGDGPLKKYYESEVLKKSLKCVHFLGNINHKEVKEIFSNSHILIHTSYREATTHVVPEAISTGLPVLCHDCFGLSIAVTNNCGIKIPLINFSYSVEGFYQKIEMILGNPEIIQRLSEGAIERSKELSWDKMAETISNDYVKIYEELKIKNKIK